MSSPFPIFGSQNLRDDDAAVIDSYDIEIDAPPKPMVEPIPIPEKLAIPPVTRMLAGTEILIPSQPAYQIWWDDANRITGSLNIYSLAATPGALDYIWIGSSPNAVNNAANYTGSGGSARRLRPSNGSDYTIECHTGALWIAPGIAITGNIEVSWMAITK